MPRLSTHHKADAFVSHHGITIYHVFKDDDFDQCVRDFWFDTKEDSRDDDSFDVRDLADELGVGLATDGSWVDVEDAMRNVLRLAIERKLIRA